MDTDRILSEEQLALYRNAGLSDKQIQLQNTPFANMSPGESVLAIAGRDKLDAYKETQAQKGIWYDKNDQVVA